MPSFGVEDNDFLQLFRDGEEGINNQDGACYNRNMADIIPIPRHCTRKISVHTLSII